MTQIDLQQAKDRFLELIELAASGEEVIICKNKQPFVRLSSVEPGKKKRQFGSAKGLIRMVDNFDAPLADFADYMGDTESSAKQAE
jgi:antitoxin (DNA-binding transcriptional repressor) of toxin-antitoxin stability system